MKQVDYHFPSAKPKPVLLTNDTPQSLRVEAKFNDAGLEITLLGRHERLRGQPLAAGQSVRLEEDDVAAG